MSSQRDLKFINPEYEIEKKGNMTVVKIPATYIDLLPTEEQKDKLLQFDEEFKNRYTEDDKDYVDTINSRITIPPLVASYMPNFRRDNRRDDRRGTKRSWENQTNYRYNPNYYHNKRQNYDNYNNGNRR